jgi:signal transduction histidine kinase
MRFWPRSLLGQVLLSVAAALLVAQAISATLLFRAAEERRQQMLVSELAFKLAAASGGRVAPSGRDGMRRLWIEVGPQPPGTPFARPEPKLTSSLSAALSAFPDNRLRAVSHEALREPRILERIASGRPQPRRYALSDARVVVASMHRPNGQWISARALMPPRERAAVRALVTQTAVLFAVLLLAMWLLLRRITEPLAALTNRVETFARTQSTDGQLGPEGPEDVRRLIEAQGRMEARIAGMIDEKDVMLGAIGHDLKTPLAALRVRIESVEDDAERGRMAAGIEDITRTLDDILSLARVGRAAEPPARTELAELAASVVEEFEDMGDPVELAEGPRVVAPVHVTWAKRALRNLVSNAVRYGGDAAVEVLRDGSEAVLRVTDNGPGIPAEHLSDMTEPFTRGEASRNRETGGAGLGLTLARAIAEAHGGRLVLANRPEGGLSAEIRLPT